MPGCSLLISVSNSDDGLLIPGTSPYLKTEGKVVGAETTGYSHRGSACQVEHGGEQKVIEPRRAFAGEWLSFLYSGGRYSQGWEHKNVKGFQSIKELLPQETP